MSELVCVCVREREVQAVTWRNRGLEGNRGPVCVVVVLVVVVVVESYHLASECRSAPSLKACTDFVHIFGGRNYK